MVHSATRGFAAAVMAPQAAPAAPIGSGNLSCGSWTSARTQAQGGDGFSPATPVWPDPPANEPGSQTADCWSLGQGRCAAPGERACTVLGMRRLAATHIQSPRQRFFRPQRPTDSGRRQLRGCARIDPPVGKCPPPFRGPYSRVKLPRHMQT